MNFNNLETKADQAAFLLKALSNDKRLMIVCVLSAGEQCVGDLEKVVGLSQSALSQHLARLRRDGIVDTRREAQTIYYSLSDPRIDCVLQCLSDIFCPECEDELAPQD